MCFQNTGIKSEEKRKNQENCVQNVYTFFVCRDFCPWKQGILKNVPYGILFARRLISTISQKSDGIIKPQAKAFVLCNQAGADHLI